MKKLSTYGRKLAMRNREAEQAKAQREFMDKLLADVRGLQIDAGVHAWTGDDGANMVNLSGRLCYIVTFAAAQAGVTADQLDMRIVRGMAEALGDFAADLDNVERYRPAIQSGLAALGRLLEVCTPFHIILAADDLEERLSTTGITTHAIQAAMEGVTTDAARRMLAQAQGVAA